MEKIEVKLEKDNNDFFREWIIKEWQHHNTVDPIYQLRIIKPEELKFKENEEYYKILEVPANETANITIKAHVYKNVDVTEIETKASAVIRLPNESGLMEDEEKCYVSEVEKALKHKVKTNVPLTDIEIPEELTLKIGEKKQIEIKKVPEILYVFSAGSSGSSGFCVLSTTFILHVLLISLFSSFVFFLI